MWQWRWTKGIVERFRGEAGDHFHFGISASPIGANTRVLEWLKSKGEGHLTRINDILTNLMEAEQRAESMQ